MMEGNPHYAQSMKETTPEWALVEAYRAMTFEMRTANLIAAIQPIRTSGGGEWLATPDSALAVKDRISKRLNL